MKQLKLRTLDEFIDDHFGVRGTAKRKKFEKDYEALVDALLQLRKDKSLNQYRNKVLFPQKVEKARQAFEKLSVPNPKKAVKQGR